ncbi:MAG: alpha/beta hydrolase [Clostridiales bacterium]|nr:alpha/beta hydrolase [Clostridiales bacterium]
MRETICGLEIEYRIQGRGKPVLLLHGWGAQIDSFYPVIQNLSTDHTVYAFDFPGHGGSDTPSTPYAVDDYAAVAKAFMERHNIVGCDTIVHSFGGRVAIKLSSKYPDLFGKLVFCDAAGIRPKRTFTYYRKVYTYKLCKRIVKVKWLVKVLKAVGVDVEKRVKGAGSAEYQVLPPVMRASFSKIVNEDLTKYLSKIKNSVLLIWGTEDTDTPLWMGQLMEEKIPDSGLVSLKGAGHFAYLDQFQQFIVITRQFLDH